MKQVISCIFLLGLLGMGAVQAQTQSKTETITYYDDLNKWVIGQVKQTMVDGLLVSKTEYGSNALPWKVYSYAKTTPDVTYTYNAADGTLATSADGNNYVTTFSSWKRGIPQSIRFPATPESPAGALLAAQVNDFGWIDWTKDELGNQTCYTYDAVGRLTGITYPAETGPSVGACLANTPWAKTTRTFVPVTSSTEYGLGLGHWRQTITTGASKQVSYFDALWRPVVSERYDNNNAAATRSLVVTRYDADGHPVFQSYPMSALSDFNTANNGIHTSYDALGRVTQAIQDSEVGALTTTTAYLSGFQTQVTNPRNKVTTTTKYQVWDQPSTALPLEITHPEGAYTVITRDDFGKPLTITRKNAAASISVTRNFYYDASQQLCRVAEPETNSTVFSYDAANNLQWSASGLAYPLTTACYTTQAFSSGRRVDRGYDARNRLQALTFPDGDGSQSWSYTPDSLPSQIDTANEQGDATVINTYSYNHRRLLTGETQSQPGNGGLDLGYGYNANGVLSSITYPSTRTIIYAPNALGQATQAGSYATGVSYYPNGAMQGFTYGNGIVHTMIQNARQLPEQSIDSGGILNDSYDYDPNGNVLAISDGLAGARGNRDMTYDGLDRLLTVVSPMFVGGAIYDYDVLDNLTHVKAPGRDHYYCYDEHWWLTNVKTTSCTGATVSGLWYDPQGNLATHDEHDYLFDFGNRLREAVDKEHYRYDGYGRRVAALSEPGAPTQGAIYSYYGQDGVLRYQRDERQGKETDYITLNGSLVAGISDPVAPGGVGLSVPATSNTGGYTVSWTSAGSATSYLLQEKIGSTWSTVQTSSATERTITGKASGTYGYRAQACSAAGCSPWSNEGTITVTRPPTMVPALTVPATSTGSYTVSWTASSSATSYTLDERINGGSWTTSYTGAALSQAYAGRAVATYDYRVKACNLGGCTAYSAIDTIQVLLPPAGTPVVTVPATSNTGNYTVSWTSTSGADSYDLQEYAGSTWTTIQSSSATSRAISGQASGSYLYRARGCNASGCGAWGNEDTIAVTLPPTAIPTLTVPTSSFTGGYTVSWTASASATSYTLEESTNGGAWTASYSGTALSKAYSGKAAGSYGYRVKACNSGGCTAVSATKTVAVTLPPSTAPTVTVPATSSTGSYSVSWTSVSTATSYRLEEQVGSGSWAEIQNAAATSKALTGKTDGSYSYRARACNVGGCSAYSTTDSITVLTPPTAVATITTPATTYTGTYAVSWTAVAKATSYTLQRSANGGAWATVATGAASTFNVTGQATGSYGYRVQGCNSAGCAGWSATKTTAVTLPPPMPASLTGNTEVDDSVRPPLLTYNVYWSASPGATSYELMEFDEVVYSGPLADFTTSGRGTRTYTVRACNVAGCSGWKGPLTLGN